MLNRIAVFQGNADSGAESETDLISPFSEVRNRKCAIDANNSVKKDLVEVDLFLITLLLVESSGR